MAFANCNSQNFCYFNNPESEPDQDYAQTYTNYDSFWKLNEFDWSDFDCLNGASIGMDWMWQPLDNTMALSPGTGLTEFDSIPDANQDAAFLSNSTQIWSPGTMTHPPKLLPPETSSTNSPSSTTPLTTSLLESPAISSILLPQSTSSSPPEPKALYTCTICQPHRCYSKPQYLTRHQKTHNKHISCLSAACTIRFAETKDMRRHVRTHHPEVLPPEQYFCPKIGCKYSSAGVGRKDNLKRHLRKVHGRLEP